jgi:hypothetical protein
MGLKAGLRFTAGTKILLFTLASKTALDLTQLSIEWAVGFSLEEGGRRVKPNFHLQIVMINNAEALSQVPHTSSWRCA